MTTILISGGTGLVGRFIVEHLLERGETVAVIGRKRPHREQFSQPVEWVPGDLEPGHNWSAAFRGVDYFIHAAFSHIPGKYRGGEGDSPQEFRRLNVDGSLALFQAAKTADVQRAVFLSSRAVYDGIAPGTILTEDMDVAPNSLYGQIKRDVELGLEAMADDRFLPISLRVTGVYGQATTGAQHKWVDLFAAFERGDPVEPRVASEVHGNDLASAIALLLSVSSESLSRYGSVPVFNVSDIIVDRRDLLAAHADAIGIVRELPARADPSKLNVMDCSRLRTLGWSPKGKLMLP